MGEPTPEARDHLLVLSAASLLSKFGFNDGDEYDGLSDWLEAQAPDVYDYVTYDWAPILQRLVRERLAPALDQHVEVVDIETSHNPIRAETVDGVDVTECWYGRQAKPRLTPQYVEVPYADVLAMIREAAEGTEEVEG